MRRLISMAWVAAAFAIQAAGAAPPPANPYFQDPLGPISDVSNDWLHYQPAEEFCIKTDVFTYPADGPFVTGSDPACAFSGWSPTDTGLYKFTLANLKRYSFSDRGEYAPGDGSPAPRTTPTLCAGCRRIFLDFSKIPASNSPPYYYAHGHAYLRFMSYNFGYYADPYAHSPNMKNFTNDKLFVPEGSVQSNFVIPFDTHGMEYVTDTAHYAHASDQGPWYIGPRYVNTAGEWINGVYLDIDVASSGPYGGTGVDEIGYQSGFNDGESSMFNDGESYCFDNDGNYFYGGCFNHFGGSTRGVDPWA